MTASDNSPRALKDLRNRCLNPGKYAQHLERWLTFYAPQQIHIIDGEMLKLNPIDVMNDVQRFLKISPAIDYSSTLKYDIKKGFFCQLVDSDHTKCLGKSKGKQYPPMEDRALKLLQRLFAIYSNALSLVLLCAVISFQILFEPQYGSSEIAEKAGIASDTSMVEK